MEYRRHAANIFDGRFYKMDVIEELKSILKMADMEILKKIHKKAIYLLRQDTSHNLKAPSVYPPAAHHKR